MKIPHEEKTSAFEAIIISSIIFLMLVLSTSFITSSFPQDILISTDTVITFDENTLRFQDIDTHGANITINNVPHYANNHDTIAMGKRNAVILTGNPTTIGDQTYYSGTLTTPTRLNHIILFDQNTISIPDTAQTIKINFKENEITLTSITPNTFRIDTGKSTYNTIIPSYFTDSNNIGLYKINHIDDQYTISLVGYYIDNEFIITTKKKV